MWQSMGGTLSGTVRSGTLPERLRTQAPAFEVTSATLGELVRDINKFSNNVMAQQVFLTLGRLFESKSATQVGTFAASRAVLQRWWTDRVSAAGAPLLDNGSGLSRQERISAQALGQLLQVAYRSPNMPELMASLPIAGVDGTLRRAKIRNSSSAHLKTGSLNNVVAVAGYVLGNSGKRYVLVALINHPNANAARPALEALIDWTAQDH
jgi:D-alanyl-D-alanine carboxypeptidase/D-alanyl-D-alanine-endopeptidase (penicillin-binding protein 4)